MSSFTKNDITAIKRISPATLKRRYRVKGLVRDANSQHRLFVYVYVLILEARVNSMSLLLTIEIYGKGKKLPTRRLLLSNF